MADPSARCRHCELPLPPARRADGFCCSGCRFLDTVVSRATDDAEDGREREDAWLIARVVLCVFFSVIVMMFSLILYSEDLFAGAGVEGALDEDARRAWRGLIRLFLLAVSTPVMALLWWPLFREWLSAERRFERAADALILTGSAAAFLLSMLATFFEGPRVYFETATAVLVLVSIGRMLEAGARGRAAKHLEALADRLPDRVCRLTWPGRSEPGAGADAAEQDVPVSEVAVGDRLRVRAGDLLVFDGRILEGSSSLDETTVTGESMPREKGPGDELYAGSRNLSGLLMVEVTRAEGERLVDRIDALLSEARARPGRRVRLAETLAGGLLPVATVLALGAGLWHGLALGGGDAGGLMVGIQAALSVLLIACPCALGLATPLAVWVGLGRLASHGVLLHSGEALERLASIRRVFFDKTGTLTTGALRARPDPGGAGEEDQALAIAAGLAVVTHHPAAAAVLQRARDRGVAAATVEAPREHPGLGVEGRREGATLRLGRPAFVFAASPESAAGAAPEPHTGRAENSAGGDFAVGLTRDGELLASWSLDEDLRAGVGEDLRALAARGVEVEVLTGDRPEAGARLSAELGVPVRAGLLPEDKLEVIEAARRSEPVAMVGDGLNDAPALARATVGLAMGGGVDLARDAAHGTLLNESPGALVAALDVARAVDRRIRWNLFWAFIWNVLGLGLAAAGQLQPVVAALAMVASSALIVSTSVGRERSHAGDAAAVERGESDVRTRDGPEATADSQRGALQQSAPVSPLAPRS